jgi:hypothetical protein
MTRHPTDHLDNRRKSIFVYANAVRAVLDHNYVSRHRELRKNWRRPETADEVIACNKIDNDLQRVVLAHELNRLEKRNGF